MPAAIYWAEAVAPIIVFDFLSTTIPALILEQKFGHRRRHPP